MRVNLSAAHNTTIVSNAVRDPDYAPYCLRCAGLYRMKKVAPMLWTHSCGATHDERQVLTTAGPHDE